jgi:hypothetical protein
MGQARTTTPPSQRPSRMPLLISILALAVSIISASLTFHVFTLTNRPYVGTVDASVGFEEKEPPTYMIWTFTTKNTGLFPLA